MDTLLIDDAERRRLNALRAEGVLDVRPVALPEGEYLVGENRHLGWPVGTRVGDALLCAYHQTLRHHGEGPRRDEISSDTVLVRSTDGGETWSGPVDIRRFGTNSEPTVLGFGNCFAVVGAKVFLATTYGLYRSVDEGLTWELAEGALTERQTGWHASEKYGGFGPRLVVHPDRGLVIPSHVPWEPLMDMYYSPDMGRTWKHERVQMSNFIHPMEPTAMYHDGRLIFVSRNQPLPWKWHRDLEHGETQRPCMMVSETGWFPMTHCGLTNISSHRWPDTTDVDFNPVTGRFEAVVTNRNGGVLENECNELHEQTVNLWSLSKEELYAGRADRWRLEGVLLRLPSGQLDHTPEDIDAGHPGGAVIDVEAGLQHIFIYCGRYATPTGVYRISRTLDTDRLRSVMRQQDGRSDAPEERTS